MSSADTANTNLFSSGAQQRNAAERLFDLFVGNERRHVINTGPPFRPPKTGNGKEDPYKWKLHSLTVEGPASVEHWNNHLNGDYILSVIPLLDDGTCALACIDADEYDLDYIEICERINRWKLPFIAVVSKSTGLHIFVFFKEPVPAKLIIPILRYWASRLRLKKFEIFPTNDGTSGEFSRAIAMPYGATWDVLPEQSARNEGGNAMLLDTFLSVAEQKKITADDLPKPPKESTQQSSRQIPLHLQAAIDSVGPYPGGDRSRITASIIWQLRDLGFDATAIEDAVKDRGPFNHYVEKKTSLKRDIDRLIDKYDLRHPNKKAKVEALPFQSSAEFVTNFVPPDYLIDGLIQRRFIYSMTGPTGEGKTSVMMVIALHVARGMSLAGREIDKSKVLFLAGENPDDVRMRWIKQLDDVKLDAKEVDVFFVPGSFELSDTVLRDQIMRASQENGPFALIVVDTSAAFFEGDDENNNIQAIAHARMLRGLIDLVTGKPTVIVTSHPVKHFSRENMIPRGGGAFMNEVDGNLTCMKVDGTMITEVHWQGKFRGIDFGAIPFRLEVGQTNKLKDSKGRLMWTVTAKPITDSERDAAEDVGQKNKGKLLAAMMKVPGASLAVLAQEVGWVTKDGKPYRSLVQRLLNALREDKLVKKETGRWVLTKAGLKAAREVEVETDEMPF
jgi:AAA domain